MAEPLSAFLDSFPLTSCPPPQLDSSLPPLPVASASSAAVDAAAPLSQVVLKKGLDSGRALLLNSAPQVHAFVDALAASAASNGDKAASVVAETVSAFRRQRAQVMRSANKRSNNGRQKSPGNISKEASIAGYYFERQIGLGLIDRLVPQVLDAARYCFNVFGYIPQNVVDDFQVYHELQVHGVESLHEQWVKAAEAYAQQIKEQKIFEMVLSGRGRECDANVRNNAASLKSYAKKKWLCELTRKQVTHVMGVRARLHNAMWCLGLQDILIEPVLATSAI